MKSCRRKYKWNTQIHLTKSEPRYKKKIEKEKSHCVGVLENYRKWEKAGAHRLNSLYWYKVIVRCTHLVARILQHGCKFSSWLKVNKISNQTVHHQSATKFDSMLQDIKKLQACKTKNTFCISDIAQKNKITNIFNHVNTDWLIISLSVKCRHRKKLQLGKQNVKTNEWLGNLCKAVKTKHWPRCFSHI